MKRKWGVALLVLSAAVGAGAYAEHKIDVAAASTRIDMVDPRGIALQDRPIRPDWILEGPARATAGEIGITHDGSTKALVWRVGNGRFNWFYDFDETVTIMDGEVYLTDGANAAPGNAKERRLGPGDVVFFHVGSVATWRVPDHVRKIATIKQPNPAVVASFGRLYATMRGWVSRGVPAKVL